jgi:glycosyltransferase involved in cell wall biosynthesis
MDSLTNQNKRILVLMPCHNEQGRIGQVVQAVKQALPHARIAVINDNSADDSALEAERAGATVLSHGSNLGYGVALETGYLYAVKADCDIVLQMDSDGQHLAEQLPLILDPIQNGAADLVIGSRYHGKSPTPATSIIRKTGHRIFSAMIFVLTGLRLSDPTSGFQALSKRTLALFSSGVFPCDYPDSDVILMAHMAGLKIKEVPVEMRNRTGGHSMHSGIKPLYYGIKMLLSMFMVLLNFRQWHTWRRKLT